MDFARNEMEVIGTIIVTSIALLSQTNTHYEHSLTKYTENIDVSMNCVIKRSELLSPYVFRYCCLFRMNRVWSPSTIRVQY